MRALFFGTVLSLAALGCGQKGPLYLRDNPPPGVRPSAVQEYKPVPYPKNAPTPTNAPTDDAPNEAPQGSERSGAVEK
jgi:predicted small lipoprotein YifL